MPDRKISELPDGAPPQDIDEYVIARAGSNFSLSYGAMTSGGVSSLSGVGAVTVATNGSTISIGAPAQSVQTQNVHNVTLSGNTAGVMAQVSSGTLTLAGGNNITLSQAGNAITISGAAAGGAQTAISGVVASDATYTSGTVTFTGVGGGVTVNSNTGQRVDISVAAQSVQPETQTFIGGISASNTLYTSGSVRFTGSQAVTVRSGTGQLVVIDAPAQTTQTQGILSAGVSTGGNTAGNTTVNTGSRLVLAGAGNISLSQATAAGASTISISGSQSVQPETQTAISGIANSQTTYTSGTVSLSELGAITIRSTTGNQFQLSVNAQTVQTQNMVAVTLSGNTSGAQALISSGTLTLAGGNNITVSQAGNAVTISGANVGGAQTGISGIANSETTYTSGTVSLSELGAITIRSTTGQQFQFSVNSQTNQAGSVYAISNTSGTSSGTYDARTLSIAGAGMITVAASNSGWRINATQSVQPETQTFVGGIGNSQTTYTSGTVNLSVVAGNLTIRSTTGQAFQFSMSQTVQPETQTAISGIANSQTTYTSGTVSLSELGAITIRSTTGNQFQFSVNSQTAQTQSNIQALYDGANSISTGTIRVTNANGVSFSVNAQTLSASVNESISMFAVSNTTQSTSGTAHKSALSFGGAGIASVGVTGGSVVVSVPAGAGQTGISGIANSQTTYTSGTVSLSELGAITIRSTTGNQYQLSVNAQTTQTQGILSMGVSTGGNTAGNTTVNTGSRMVLVGLGEVSLSQATAAGASTISISAPAQTVQTQGGFLSAGVSTGGNTLGNTQVSTGSRLVLVGAGMITASQATAAGASTITLNATQSVQPETQTFIAGIRASDTTYTSGNVTFTGVGGGVTVSSNTGQRVDISVAAPVAATNLSVGASNIGNTAGDTGVATGSRLVIAGGNNITISQGTAAGATTLTISAPNLGAGAFSGGASNLGNTAGDTGITGTRLIMVGSNNITLSQATDANGGTLSFIGGGGGGFSGGVSTGGNTAGATGITGSQNVFVGVTPISLSQTTGANGGTISINAPATSSLSATGQIQISTNGSTISIGDGGNTVADWQNFPQGEAQLQTLIAGISKTPFYWHDSLPGRITANSLAFKVSFVTANTLASMSAHLGVYSFVNSTSMALIGSVSEAYVISTATSASFSGVRHLLMTGIGTHTALSVLQPGVYGFGMMFSAGASQSMNASLMGASTANGPLGLIFPGTNSVSTGTSQGVQALWGRGSTTVNAMPSGVVRSELVNQGSGASVQLHPWIYIRS